MKINKKSLVGLITVLAVFSVCYVTAVDNLKEIEKAENTAVVNDNSNLTVHFIDVGQGDSSFIELPNGKCMLIDASTDVYSKTVIDTVESYGYSKIDYVVATHMHDDHIGAMDEVLEYFEIGKIYMPSISANSDCYEDLISVISDKQVNVITAKSGVQILNNDNLEINILSPVDSTYSEENNYSAVVKITYGDDSFIFMGDAEKLVENQLVEMYGSYIDADVIKVGHHGSSNSSSEEFLQVVTPDYAVISCGKENPYGHPNEDALERLENCDAEIYCTDECSTITISCDGQDNFEISY